jgi:hypothetical protein
MESGNPKDAIRTISCSEPEVNISIYKRSARINPGEREEVKIYVHSKGIPSDDTKIYLDARTDFLQ